MTRLKTTVFALLLLSFNLLHTAAYAHDATLPTPEGLSSPTPPVLPQPTGQQTLYRIDATQSSASYFVQETFVGGIEGKLVEGTTIGIAGDVLIDWAEPMRSQLGMVTVDVEQLTSDSRQRDRQIRSGYLESSLFPEATFIPENEQVFPNAVSVGDRVTFTLHGFLTVRNVTIFSDWDVELTLEAERIVGRATTDIRMSDFGVGPINIVGLLKTEDAMQLTFDFVALADGLVAEAVTAEVDVAQVPTTESDLTFADIRPILETKCVGCHVEGELGHTLFPMETVGDVTDYASDIALVVETEYMPPWPPSDEAPQFLHDRSLSEQDKADLLAWLNAGAQSDVPSDTPLNDTAATGIVVRPDLVMQMPQPYMPSGEVEDDYRCFLLDPQLDEGAFVTASEIVPDQRQVAHHSFLFQVSADLRDDAIAKEAEDDAYGWTCFGNHELGTGGDPAAVNDSISAWVPGARPVSFREGTGIWVEPGNLLVLQIHYNYAAGFVPDQSSIVLQLEPPEAELTPVRGMSLVAPVELHCPEGIDTPRCDRDTLLREEGGPAQFLAFSNLARCGQTVADYANQPVDDIDGVCDLRVPVDGNIVQVGGHMHTHGKRLRVELNPDGPNPIVLQDIPVWDFDWQGAYQLAEPIPIAQNDIIRITCVHDNSAETDPEKARFIYYSEGTNDEMCLTVLRIEPTPEFYELSSMDMLAGSINTIPSWLPVSTRLPAFVMSLIPLPVYLALLAVLCTIGWLIMRRRARKAVGRTLSTS